MILRGMVLALVGVLLAACSTTPSDLVIVSRTLKGQANVNTSIPMEFGATAPPAGKIYWVEGKIRNTGEKDYRNVQLGFKCSDGSRKIILTAELPLVPAGKTVDFRTQQQSTQASLRLLEEDPDIYYER